MFRTAYLWFVDLSLWFVDLPVWFVDLPLWFVDLPLWFVDLPLWFVAFLLWRLTFYMRDQGALVCTYEYDSLVLSAETAEENIINTYIRDLCL